MSGNAAMYEANIQKSRNGLWLLLFLFVGAAAIAQAQTISQSIDLPGWLKPGMSLEDARTELSKLKIQLNFNEFSEAYEYTKDNILYGLGIDPDDGLISFQASSSDKFLNFQSALSYLTGKYGKPEKIETKLSADIYLFETKIPEWDVAVTLCYLTTMEYILVEYEFSK